jgi:hypothetical protein
MGDQRDRQGEERGRNGDRSAATILRVERFLMSSQLEKFAGTPFARPERKSSSLLQSGENAIGATS